MRSVAMPIFNLTWGCLRVRACACVCMHEMALVSNMQFNTSDTNNQFRDNSNNTQICRTRESGKEIERERDTGRERLQHTLLCEIVMAGRPHSLIFLLILSIVHIESF